MRYLLLLLLSVSILASAQDYLSAKRAIADGEDIAVFSELKTHPLYAYLAADFYRQHLDRDSEIIALLNEHYSSSAVKKLHNRWMVNNYQRQQWQHITQHYFDTGSQQANCIYRSALLYSGQEAAALENIQSVWMSPRSVSDYCSPVFSAWGKTTNPQLIYQRAILAYHAGNPSFAARMADKLMNTQGRIIAQFTAYWETPTSMLMLSPAELTQTPLHKELLPQALKQLVRKDSSQYAAFAMQFAPQMRGNQRYQDLLSTLTEYLSNRHDSQARQTFALLQQPNKQATEALIRYLVVSQQWDELARLISPNNPRPMAQYWLGRAEEKNGNNRQARNAYEKAAKIRSYYGFLAADKLGQNYQFNYQPIHADREQQRYFDGNNSLIRAKALYQYGEDVAARKEILAISKKMSPPVKRQLAYWLNKQGLHFEAIYLLGQSKDWNDIGIRFPTPYNKEIQYASQITGTDATWAYAILRQESSMNPRAVSRARAQGLMQIIPPTARRVAHSMGIDLSSNSIFDPSINTQIGSKYLADMYSRFGSIALASAAYNAGPGRVVAWTNDALVDDVPAWVEGIPFNETRRYVKRILEYQQVYAKHLGKKIPRVTEIMAIDINVMATPEAL